MNFLRLKNRAKELDKLFMETKNSVYGMEEDCIAHLFEAEGFQRYNTVLNFAEKNGHIFVSVLITFYYYLFCVSIFFK